MTDEQRFALELADALEEAIAGDGDGSHVGITDSEFIIKALRAYPRPPSIFARLRLAFAAGWAHFRNAAA